MIVIVKISLNLIERVIWNHPPPLPPRLGEVTIAGPRGAAPVGSRGKAPVWGGVQGTERSGVPLPKGGPGEIQWIAPCHIFPTQSVQLNQYKNQQPDIHITLNIQTEGARKRGAESTPCGLTLPRCVLGCLNMDSQLLSML